MVGRAECPRLRRDLVVRRIPGDDETSYVAKDPQTRKYYRFPEAAGLLMGLFDGRTSLPEIQQRLRRSGKPVPGIGAIEAFVQHLRAKDLLDLSAAERLEHQMERIRTERRLRVRWRNAHGSLLHYRFCLWDPDRWMDRVVPRLRFFWTPTFLVLSLITILVATGIVAANAELFTGQFLRFVMGGAAWHEYVGFMLISLLIIAIHELGHGLTCKQFGGRVHEIGFLVIYFMPCFYCNVNDVWLFPRRSERLWVTVAGGYIELFVGALAALIWWATEPGHPVNQVAFQAALIGTLAAALVNLNPLIKLDGYYALVDYLGAPNLRENSFRYVRRLSRRLLLGASVPLPSVSRRTRRIWLAYGLLAGAYSIGLLAVGACRAFEYVVVRAHDWGVAAAAGVLFLLALPALRSLAARPPAGGVPGTGRPRWPVRIGAAVLLLALSVFPHWAIPLCLACVFEPARRATLLAPDNSRVIEVLCGEGEVVRQGRILLRLQGPEGQVPVTAPITGTCLTWRPEELVGRTVTRGEPLLVLGDTRMLLASAHVGQRDSGAVRPGAVALLMPHGQIGATLEGRVRDLTAKADASGFRLVVPLADPGTLRPGMTGSLKVYGPRRNLVGHLREALLRLVRADLWG